MFKISNDLNLIVTRDVVDKGDRGCENFAVKQILLKIVRTKDSYLNNIAWTKIRRLSSLVLLFTHFSHTKKISKPNTQKYDYLTLDLFNPGQVWLFSAYFNLILVLMAIRHLRTMYKRGKNIMIVIKNPYLVVPKHFPFSKGFLC